MAGVKGMVNNPTGKGGAKKGEARNPSGMPKGMPERYNKLRDKILNMTDEMWPQIVAYAKENPGELLKEAIKILPKDINMGGEVKHQWIVTRFAKPTKPE